MVRIGLPQATTNGQANKLAKAMATGPEPGHALRAMA